MFVISLVALNILQETGAVLPAPWFWVCQAFKRKVKQPILIDSDLGRDGERRHPEKREPSTTVKSCFPQLAANFDEF